MSTGMFLWYYWMKIIEGCIRIGTRSTSKHFNKFICVVRSSFGKLEKSKPSSLAATATAAATSTVRCHDQT
jgi:hypothetical protein